MSIRINHGLLFLVAIVSGITAFVIGVSTGTGHNVFFGIMFLVIGRVLATADNIDPENPLEEI